MNSRRLLFAPLSVSPGEARSSAPVGGDGAVLGSAGRGEAPPRGTQTPRGVPKTPPWAVAAQLLETALCLSHASRSHASNAAAGERSSRAGELAEWAALLDGTAELKRVDLSTQSGDELLAFWLNVYHLLLLHVTLLLGPPLKAWWLWKQASYEVGGFAYSLLELEHRVLRARTARPRSLGLLGRVVGWLLPSSEGAAPSGAAPSAARAGAGAAKCRHTPPAGPRISLVLNSGSTTCLPELPSSPRDASARSWTTPPRVSSKRASRSRRRRRCCPPPPSSRCPGSSGGTRRTFRPSRWARWSSASGSAPRRPRPPRRSTPWANGAARGRGARRCRCSGSLPGCCCASATKGAASLRRSCPRRRGGRRSSGRCRVGTRLTASRDCHDAFCAMALDGSALDGSLDEGPDDRGGGGRGLMGAGDEEPAGRAGARAGGDARRRGLIFNERFVCGPLRRFRPSVRVRSAPPVCALS